MIQAAADIIRKYPGPIVLCPTSTKGVWWFLMLGSATMASASVIVIWVALSDLNLRPALGFGILGLLFFAMGAIVGAILLRPNSGLLSLSATGFEVTYLYRKRFYYWEQVDDFAVYSSKGSNTSCFARRSHTSGFGTSSTLA